MEMRLFSFALFPEIGSALLKSRRNVVTML